jgi:hypothetical protein
MSYTRTGLAGLIPVGFQSFSLSNSTAVAINSTLRGATVLSFSVETQNARMRADGTAPALTTGVLYLTTTTPHWIFGYNGTAAMKFQRSTGTCKIQMMGYKHPGDSR